jgi:hypothetical protein
MNKDMSKIILLVAAVIVFSCAGVKSDKLTQVMVIKDCSGVYLRVKKKDYKVRRIIRSAMRKR